MHRLRRRREGFEAGPALLDRVRVAGLAIECTGCASLKFLSPTS